MSFSLIRPERADVKAHLQALRPAFTGIDDPKGEFDFCCQSVMSKAASLYQLKLKGVSVRFVGLVTNNRYLILAMTGRGLVKAAPYIINAVRQQGYKAIDYHTVKPGMTRILRRFGFVETGKSGSSLILSKIIER